jgi:hypothetical protein
MIARRRWYLLRGFVRFLYFSLAQQKVGRHPIRPFGAGVQLMISRARCVLPLYGEKGRETP